MFKNKTTKIVWVESFTRQTSSMSLCGNGDGGEPIFYSFALHLQRFDDKRVVAESTKWINKSKFLNEKKKDEERM